MKTTTKEKKLFLPKELEGFSKFPAHTKYTEPFNFMLEIYSKTLSIENSEYKYSERIVSEVNVYRKYIANFVMDTPEKVSKMNLLEKRLYLTSPKITKENISNFAKNFTPISMSYEDINYINRNIRSLYRKIDRFFQSDSFIKRYFLHQYGNELGKDRFSLRATVVRAADENGRKYLQPIFYCPELKVYCEWQY